MRLIDADALPKYTGMSLSAFDVAIEVENAPEIVVRCKDCKWWKTNYFWNGTEHKVCVIEPYEPCRNPNDYCSCGERKDGADDAVD